MNKDRVKVPELRFPEFEGEWRLERLGTIADIQSGYAFSSLKMLREKSRYQLIKMSNVYLNKLSLERSPSYWLEINTKIEKFLLKKNDIVVTLTGTIGKQDYGYSVLIPKDDEFLLNQRLVRLRRNSTISIAEFILPVLKLSKFKYYFFNEGKGGTGNQSNVGIEDLKNIKLLFPNLPEQTKIANFLTSVDKCINLLQKKKAEFTQYKKGVMQKLFDVKADGCPALRFKQDDGSDFPDWKEKKLGEVVDTKMGQSPDSKSYNLNGGGLPLIQGNADITDRFSNPRQWTNQSTKTCEIGDLILTVRAPVGSISKSKHNACIGRGVCSIKNRSNSSLEFIYQFLLWYEPKWISLEQGSTFTAVSGKDIQNLKFAIPTSKKEQQKIADFLSSIDKSIENIANQIEQSQKWKKGLLQKMFV